MRDLLSPYYEDGKPGHTRLTAEQMNVADFGSQPPPGNVFPVNNAADWAAAIGAMAVSNNYVINLGASFSLSDSSFSSVPGVTVSVRGNHTITLSTPGALFSVAATQTLILWDTTLAGHSANTHPVVQVGGTNGTLAMKGSSAITGNTISTTSSGGGVIVSSGTFTMYDNAQVHNNHTSSLGGGAGGVYVQGTFTMYGNARVHHNTAGTGGGGGVIVFASATFTMYDNTSVHDNTTTGGNGGGGVSINGSASLTMNNNATVRGNQAISSNGGGVVVATGTTLNLNTAAGTASISGNTGGAGPQVLKQGTGIFNIGGSPIGNTY